MLKIFNDKKIKISKLSKKDLGRVKEFQAFINSLVEEDAQIRVNRKQSLKEEKEWLERNLLKSKKQKAVILIAEHNNEIVGNVGIDLGKGRNDHMGKFWIAIKKGYRNVGLGTYLAKEIIKLAKKELRPKIIILDVYPTNKRAIKFYQRLGFKKVASIPRYAQYKGRLVSEIVMLLDLIKFG